MAAKKEGETPRRMACWNCPRYSRTDRQCADGKANPKKKADSVMVAEALGLRALCHYNPYRDALAARMYFPNTRLGIHSVPPRRARRGKYGDLTLPEEPRDANQLPENNSPEADAIAANAAHNEATLSEGTLERTEGT